MKQADEKKINLLNSMIKEETENPPDLEKILKELSLSVLKDEPGAKEKLDSILSGFTEDIKATDSGKVFFTYLAFLKDLTQAEDRDKFLKQADGEMVEILMALAEEAEK